MVERKFWRIALLTLVVVTISMAVGSSVVGSARSLAVLGSRQQAAPLDSSKVIDGVPCGLIHQLGIDRQMNLHARYIMIACGLEPGLPTGSERGSGNIAFPTHANPAITTDYGGPDVSLNSDNALNPRADQSASMVWANDNIIAVVYDDARNGPNCYSSLSISSDGGTSFIREDSAGLCNGHGSNYGDPIVVYNAHLGQWFAGDLTSGCGSQGIGIWSSANALNWTPTAPGCALSSSQGDHESIWVDNNAASPHYGRMYVSFNDFSVNAGSLEISHSDDGAIWSAPIVVHSAFQRNQLLTGSQGSDGSVYLAAMDELGGGLGNRQNYVYKSTDGGLTFAQVYVGPVFPSPGSSTCGYFARINSVWRYMGAGQPAATANGIIALTYSARGSNGDDSDVYLVRSTNFGVTWSVPVKLNTDTATHEQWMPSLSASAGGALFASWYDRRNTTDGLNYQVYGRLSTDGGATWQADQPVSDIIIHQPGPTTGQTCSYTGYNVQSANGSTALVTWLEGRVLVNNYTLANIYFDAVNMSGAGQHR